MASRQRTFTSLFCVCFYEHLPRSPSCRLPPIPPSFRCSSLSIPCGACPAPYGTYHGSAQAVMPCPSTWHGKRSAVAMRARKAEPRHQPDGWLPSPSLGYSFIPGGHTQSSAPGSVPGSVPGDTLQASWYEEHRAHVVGILVCMYVCIQVVMPARTWRAGSQKRVGSFWKVMREGSLELSAKRSTPPVGRPKMPSSARHISYRPTSSLTAAGKRYY